MDIGTRKELSSGTDKGIDQSIIPLAAYPLLPQAQVQRVVEQVLVVGSTVKNDRKHPIRMYPGAESSEGELGDGYQDAAAALVADA